MTVDDENSEKPEPQGVGPEPAEMSVAPGTPEPTAPSGPPRGAQFGPAPRVMEFASSPASLHFAQHPTVPDIYIVTMDTPSTRLITFWPRGDLERALRKGLSVIGAMPDGLVIATLGDMPGEGGG